MSNDTEEPKFMVVVLCSNVSIIAGVVADGNTLNLTLPYRILYAPNGSMIIMRYLPEINDVTMAISTTDVLLVGEPEPHILDAYMDAVSPLRKSTDTLH